MNCANDENFEQYRYRFTIKGLSDELHELIDHYGASFARDSGPVMPFVPLTHDSQQEWPDASTGIEISFDGFENMCKNSPKALFQEMKLCTFVAMGYKDLIRDLHDVLKTNDLNLAVICEHAIAFADALTKTNDTIATLRNKNAHNNDRGVPVRSANRLTEDQQLTE
ncbi:Uu.00g050990.m01.CDS01 [Anthostomella pinea]|uniref:Uu.00g050990.m01.CDS01 n=1 Tax=Anthostomella pinea TaxID=933095 RepID=A0AAI8YKA3_9PEZI|nr:Uu.00g050990.m01.CDS01 [Anthostomella pinea]